MARPPLSAEDRAAWARVAETARPLAAGATGDFLPARQPLPIVTLSSPARSGRPVAAAGTRREVGVRRPVAAPADTLDGGWDRRLRRGAVQPDRALDLHGHTLAGAQRALEAALGDALAADMRVLLVVTGKPPRSGEARRGLIRAAIFDWLAHSSHASRIAAVRNAHPRHGGAGALYVILRRIRGG